MKGWLSLVGSCVLKKAGPRGMKNSWGRSGAHVSMSDVEDIDRDLKIWIPSLDVWKKLLK